MAAAGYERLLALLSDQLLTAEGTTSSTASRLQQVAQLQSSPHRAVTSHPHRPGPG